MGLLYLHEFLDQLLSTLLRLIAFSMDTEDNPVQTPTLSRKTPFCGRSLILVLLKTDGGISQRW